MDVPAHEQAGGHAEERGEHEGLKHAPDADADVGVIVAGIDGDPVDGVLGDPLLEAGHGAGELFKIGKLEIFRRQVPEEDEGHQAERVQVRGRTLQPEFRIRQRHFPGAWAFGRLALHDGLAHGVPLGVGVGSGLGNARWRGRGRDAALRGGPGANGFRCGSAPAGNGTAGTG